MLRPYIALIPALADHNDSVHVVWHDNERVQRNSREMLGNLAPTLTRDTSGVAEAHAPVHDLPEEGDAPSYANRHEVRPRTRVIEPLKPQVPPLIRDSKGNSLVLTSQP